MHILESATRTLRFSVFEVDLRAAELRKHGVRVKLQDQPFRILSRLLENRGDIVTREELRQELWQGHTFVDFDRSLNKAMAKLRSALGDSAETPRYIETIPRHGYRLLVPVEQNQTQELQSAPKGMRQPATEEAAADFPLSTSKTDFASIEKPARLFYSVTDGWSFSFLMAVIVTLIVVAGLMSLRLKQSEILNGQSALVNPRRSVAVLGFRNLSGNPHDAWLSTAFADWLATELSAGDQLRTVGAENIARMKMELQLPEMDSLGPDSLSRIRKDLGSDLVVAGSYAMLGKESNGQIRLDVRLLDTHTGETLFATSETGSDANLFNLASRAGENLREKLGIRKVTQAEAVEVALVLPSSPEAARLYAEGLAHLRVFNALGAQSSLTRAIAADPKFALAHSALATAWAQLGYGQNAVNEAKKSVELSSSLPRAERLLVEGRYRELSLEWDKAISIYHALFEFFPDNPDYGLQLAHAQIKAARWREALATVAALRALPAPMGSDPRLDMAEGDAARSLGDMKRAELAMAAAAEKSRSSGALLLLAKARLAQAWLYQNLGQLNEVESAVKEATELYNAAHDRKGVADAVTIQAITLEAKGDYQSALQKYKESLAILTETGDEPGAANENDNLGDIYLYVGDLSAASKSYANALAIYEKTKDDDGVALAKIGLGDVALAQGRHAEGKKFYEGALEICRRIGDRGREASALYGLGQIFGMEGDFGSALQSEAYAKSIFKEVGDRVPQAQVAIARANLLFDQGNSEDAAVAVREATELLSKVNDPRDRAFADIMLARTAMQASNVQEATKAVARAQGFADRSRDKALEIASRLELARIDASVGDLSRRRAAIKTVRALAQDAKAAGYQYASLQARLTLGKLLESDPMMKGTGRLELTSLRKEAAAAGFGIIADHAAVAERR
jgi:DNA-binding winged helix-turn-helix (wHTH) protein/tetratricopeptide (TPR) repeat protein